MNITTIADKLKELKIWDQKINKFTLLVNEKQIEQGAIFFVPIGTREYKIVLQAPYHQDIVVDGEAKTYQKLLSHKEAILLK